MHSHGADKETPKLDKTVQNSELVFLYGGP
jgi:hypothetical protein